MDITRTIDNTLPLSDEARLTIFGSLPDELKAFRKSVIACEGRIPTGSALDVSLQTTLRVHPYFVGPQTTPVRLSHLHEGLHGAFLVRAHTIAIANGVVGAEKWLRAWHGEDILVSRPGKQTQARDLAWEFVVASTCSRFADSVRCAEPDVRCNFADQRWGIACKVFYTGDSDTQIDRMVEGAKQIAKCDDIDHGAVLINVTPLVNHEMWRRDRVNTRDEANELFTAEIARVANGIHRDKLYQRFLPRENADCFMFFAQTVFDIDDDFWLMATALFPLNLREASNSEAKFLRAFNESAKTFWL